MSYNDIISDRRSHNGSARGAGQSGPGSSGDNSGNKTRTSRDATTINPEKRAPIDPRMPDLPPA